MPYILVVLILLVCGCSKEHLHTEFLTPVCIKPFKGYHFLTCCKIKFKIDGDIYEIPPSFETDLASIPRVLWPLMAPDYSKIIQAAVVHDWFYRKTCDFNRQQTDLIFYHMLINDGVNKPTSLVMYYSVRLFGKPFYKEDYCDEYRS